MNPLRPDLEIAARRFRKACGFRDKEPMKGNDARLQDSACVPIRYSEQNDVKVLGIGAWFKYEIGKSVAYAVEDRDKQFFLAVEIAIDSWLRHAAAGRDLIDARAIKSAFDENLGGSLKNLVARRAAGAARLNNGGGNAGHKAYRLLWRRRKSRTAVLNSTGFSMFDR